MSVSSPHHDPSAPTLWIAPSTCSLAPHVLFRMSGLPFNLQIISIIPSGFPASLLAKNPKGRVPILEFPDGTLLTETVAIMTWIDRSAPEKHLFGGSLMRQVRCYEWLNWLSGKVHEHGFGSTFKPSMFTVDDAGFEGVQAKGRETLDFAFGEIERRVEGGHAVEGVFTVVDVFLYVMYRWGFMMKIDMPGKYPKWTEVVRGVTERKEVREASEIEGIPLVEDSRVPPKGVVGDGRDGDPDEGRGEGMRTR